MHVLLRQQNAHALLLERQDHVDHLLHNHRRHTLGGLIQQHQVGVAHQGAGHRQHLLLTAAHAPTHAVWHFTQVRKELEQPLGRPQWRLTAVSPAPRRLLANHQVLSYRQIGEDAAVFGHITQPHARRVVRLAARDVLTQKSDAATALAQHANQGFQRG